jgi:hypothetical protein
MAAPSQRRALGVLFAALAAVLAAVAVAALLGAGGNGARWLIAVAALALAGWLGSLAVSGLRRR